MVFNRLSILGVGLLGGSIGLAVKSIAKSCQIVGYGHRDASIGKALAMGAIDRGFASARQAVQDAALVLVCTPVGTFQSIFQEIANSLSPGAIVTDVGSTKRSAVRLAEELLPGHVRFVGSHPMAGSEKRGVESARADLFNGATCVVTPTDRTDPQALGAVEEFWREEGGVGCACRDCGEFGPVLGDESGVVDAKARIEEWAGVNEIEEALLFGAHRQGIFFQPLEEAESVVFVVEFVCDCGNGGSAEKIYRFGQAGFKSAFDVIGQGDAFLAGDYLCE